MITSIKWVVYDGTAGTRPHSIRKRACDAGKRQQAKLSKLYLLRRAKEGRVEDQAYMLHAKIEYDRKKEREYFRGWLWCGVYPDGYEMEIDFPLAVGDTWAEWPLPPQPEAQP